MAFCLHKEVSVLDFMNKVYVKTYSVRLIFCRRIFLVNVIKIVKKNVKKETVYSTFSPIVFPFSDAVCNVLDGIDWYNAILFSVSVMVPSSVAYTVLSVMS